MRVELAPECLVHLGGVHHVLQLGVVQGLGGGLGLGGVGHVVHIALDQTIF